MTVHDEIEYVLVDCSEDRGWGRNRRCRVSDDYHTEEENERAQSIHRPIHIFDGNQ